METARDLILREWQKVISALELLVAKHFLALQNTPPNAVSLSSHEKYQRDKCDEYRTLLHKARHARATILAGKV